MRENKTRPHEAGSAEANVPEISVTDPADHSTLEAALIYAKAGFYVGPLKAGTKNPGSVLGDNWHQKTTRDPQVIVAMFAGTDHGVFLHVGRSDALVFDVDNPEQLPELLRRAFREVTPPYQSTRPDTPGRGHYVFRQPPGRDLGNSLGRLGNGWVRFVAVTVSSSSLQPATLTAAATSGSRPVPCRPCPTMWPSCYLAPWRRRRRPPTAKSRHSWRSSATPPNLTRATCLACVSATFNGKWTVARRDMPRCQATSPAP